MELAKVFDNFLLQKGAKSAEIIEACIALELRPSAEYVAVLEFTNGGEGFIGQNYLRLYSTKEVLTFNRAYQVSRFTPDLVVFGTTGYGEAYAFDKRHLPAKIVRVPFIPLDEKVIKPLCADVSVFLQMLFGDVPSHNNARQPIINPEAVGKEAHQRHPIAFGGSPTDPANTVLVPAENHAELCVFWNDKWHSLKSKAKLG